MIIFDPVCSPGENEEFKQFEVSSEASDEPQLELAPPLPEHASRETFLQRDSCFNTSRGIKHCYECVDDPDTSKYSCRFFEFRKLERVNKKHKVVGFLDPHIDPTATDLALWTLADKSLEVDQQTTDYILTYIASDFCEMVDAEMEVYANSKAPAWKRSVLQVREMCDVCDTSVFNFHWTCKYCGHCVCIDCNKERKAEIIRFKRKTKAEKEERDKFFWIRCPHRSDHEKMMLTQMATGSSLMNLNQNLHKLCEKRNITQRCGCSLRTNSCLKIESKRMLQENLHNRNKSGLLELRTLMKRQRHKMKATMKRRLSLIEQQKLNLVRHTFVAQTQVLKIIEPSESVDCYKLFQNHWEKVIFFLFQ